jgi:hypothetical protein
MHSRARVAAIAWTAGLAGLALALSVTALVAGHATSPVPAAHTFRPVVVPPAPPGAPAPAPAVLPVGTLILEADLARRRHPAPDVPAIRATRHSLAKPRPVVKSKPKVSTHHRSHRKPAPQPKPAPLPSVAQARSYARSRIGSTQFGCLDSLWTKESNWNPRAYNSSSGAYGIPQALPGSKMASIAGDWRYNPLTQVRWGLAYIGGRYGTACSAWSHSVRYNWY